MSHDTQQLAQLMTQRHECLSQLCELGRRQLELIAASDLAQLLRLLSAKQRVLTSLQSIERALDPYRGQQPEERRWRSSAEREACAAMAASCDRLLGEIVSQEKRSESQLGRHRDDAAHRLQGAHAAALARGAYISESPMQSGQLDLSSGS